LAPGSGIRDLGWVKNQVQGYEINNRDHISESLETIFFKFFDGDPGSGIKKIRIWDPGWKKFRIRDPVTNIPDPQHCFLCNKSFKKGNLNLWQTFHDLF
jgi:hypothetical protein